MAENVVPITSEGYQKLENELNYLRTVRRDEVAERLRLALEEGGDLTENAEYDSAREEQASIEGRIAELEETMKRAEVVKNNKCPVEIDVGCRVRVHLEDQDQEFQIVGAPEADPTSGKISNESPLGQALLGKKVGEKIEVDAPVGKLVYKILDIVFKKAVLTKL